jgi:hypothetical protein
MAQVVIRHRDGREFEVSESDFRRAKVEQGKTYDELGFKIVRNADGSEYEAPAPRAAEKPADGKKGE